MKDYERYAYDIFTLRKLTTLSYIWYNQILPRAKKMIGQIREAIIYDKYIYHHCRSLLR